MRDYAKLSPKFWIGDTGRALRGAGSDVQVLALYLLSSPHANMLGLYYLPITFLAYETGLTVDGARTALSKAIELGFCAYDEAAEIVWVYEMARFQIGEQLEVADKRCKGVQKEYLDLPANEFLAEFFDKHSGRFHLQHRRGDADGTAKPLPSPIEAPCETLRSQEQEQEQDLPLADASGAVGEARPPCPHAAATALWHELMPELPRVTPSRWSGSKSEANLRARWRQGLAATTGWWRFSTTDDGLAKFRELLKTCRESSFLMGRVYDPRKGPFELTLHWLVKRENFDKVLSNTYHREAA